MIDQQDRENLMAQMPKNFTLCLWLKVALHGTPLFPVGRFALR